MKRVNFTYVFAIAVLAFQSCYSSNEITNNISDSNAVTSYNANKQNDANQSETKFVIDIKGEGDNISSDVWVSLGKKPIFLAGIFGKAEIIEKSEYKSKGIPKNAISACGAWWAGAGEYFYMVPSKKGVVVFKGSQSEEQKTAGYHWKKFKVIAR